MQNSNDKVAAAFLSQSEKAALWGGFASNMELKSEHSRGAEQLHHPHSFIHILAPGGCGSEPQQCACGMQLARKTISSTTFYLSNGAFCFSSHDILALLERAEWWQELGSSPLQAGVHT